MKNSSGGAQRLSLMSETVRFSALSLGLGTFFSSLLIYAGTVTPFLHYESIAGIMSPFARWSLAALLVVALLLATLVIKGVRLPSKALMGSGSILYLLSAVCFCYLAVSEVGFGALLYLAAIACGAGGCLMCLVWGRLFRRFPLGSALLNISIACVFASCAYAAFACLPLLAGVGVFITCAVVAVIVPLLARHDHDGASLPVMGEADAPATMRKLSSFLDVVTKPALGLLVFSYVMGLTCYTFVDVFDLYLAASLISAVTLGVLALVKLRRVPLTRLLYRDLIPLIAIVALAVPNITNALIGSSPLTMFSTLLLYTFAAFLTLATLCAIAHASEFSSDFIFVIALALFAAASLAGLVSSELLSPAMANVMVTVVTTVYAFLMLVIRNTESDSADDPLGLARNAAESTTVGAKGADGGADKGAFVVARCDQLATECDLTAREREILGYLAECRNAPYISEVLFISPNTVRTHIHNIYRKLGAASREDVLKLIHEL